MLKNITVEDNKKRMNITNFTNIYTNIYTNNISDKIDSKQKWFNKLVLLTIIILYYFLLQDFHIWSVSQTVEMEDSYHLLSFKNEEQFKYFWAWKSLAVKAFKDCKKQHRTFQSRKKNKNNNFIIFVRSISSGVAVKKKCSREWWWYNIDGK